MDTPQAVDPLPELPPPASTASVCIDQLVEAFLTWKLPPSVCSDLCVTRSGEITRTGTNLLTASEARQMFEHVLERAFDPIPKAADPLPDQPGPCNSDARVKEFGAALARIRDFPFHSEPVGGAYAMQDIAEQALKGGAE